MECSEARDHLSAFDGQATPMKEIVDHLAACEDCRAEQNKFAELRSALAELAELNVEPPSWLLASLTETTLEHARRVAAFRATSRQIGEHRVAAGGAILLAGAAALLLGRSRLRSRKVRTSGLVAA